MTTYRSLNHTKWHCQYHVVFIPKYRRKAMYGGLRRDLGEVFRRGLALHRESEVEEGHLLCGPRAYDDVVTNARISRATRFLPTRRSSHEVRSVAWMRASGYPPRPAPTCGHIWRRRPSREEWPSTSLGSPARGTFAESRHFVWAVHFLSRPGAPSSCPRGSPMSGSSARSTSSSRNARTWHRRLDQLPLEYIQQQ